MLCTGLCASRNVQCRHVTGDCVESEWQKLLGRDHTLGIDGLHTGMILPDILFKFLLMNSSGLGPTTRWIRSMLFSSGGIAAVNVPKLLARACIDTTALSNV